ncbi:MAG: iron ABC transporter permease, partial [Clostridia bacterium]
NSFTFANYIKFFTKKYYYSALLRSLFVSITVTFTTMLIGVPLAYLMTRYNVFGKKYLHIFIIMCLMSPPFIGAYSWILLFGRAGLITGMFKAIGITLPTIYGRLGTILVFTFKLFPYIYLYVAGAMGSIDASLEEAAENLGSSKLRRLWTVTLPVILPSIAAGATMVFMTSLSDFGTPMLIGEGYTVLPVLVYNEYMSEIGGNANLASALSVVIVSCSLIVLFIQNKVIARKNYVMTAMRPPQEEKFKGIKRFLISLPAWIIVGIGFMPQIVVTVTSFIKTDFSGFKNEFSLDSYRNILSRLSTNIVNTFSFSAIAIVIIILFGMLVSYIIVRQKGVTGRIIDNLIMFPYV